MLEGLTWKLIKVKVIDVVFFDFGCPTLNNPAGLGVDNKVSGLIGLNQQLVIKVPHHSNILSRPKGYPETVIYFGI